MIPSISNQGFRLWANDFYRILRLRTLWYMVNTRYHFINYRLQARNIQIFTNRIPKINAKTQNLECELAIISALQTDHVLNHMTSVHVAFSLLSYSWRQMVGMALVNSIMMIKSSVQPLPYPSSIHVTTI